MCAASVTVHHLAFSERRFDLLAKLLGVSLDDASFKMARLWSAMTELQTDIPPVDVIRVVMLDEQGELKLVRACLAEQLEDGRVRIRGRYDNDTGKDRLQWYAELRDRQVEAGRSRAASAPRDRRGRLLPGIGPAVAQLSPANAPACPASIPNTDPLDLDPILSSSGADPRGDRDLEGQEEIPLPPNPPLRDVNVSPTVPITGELTSTLAHVVETKGINNRIWARLGKLRAEIAEELGVTVRALHPMDAGTRALAMRVREASLAKLDAERIEGDLNHVLDVVAAEARATKSVQWLTGAVFEERAFRRALGMTIADAERPRSGPPNNNRPGPKPEPVRHIPKI